MARANTSWFMFRGRRSDECGVRVIDPLQYTRPEWRGKSQTVTGRSGDLWRTESTTHIIYETIELKRTLHCRLSRMEEVAAWLTGAGELIFSWAENRAYNARAQKAANFKQISPDVDPLIEFDISFACQPFRYIIPAADPITITASGTTIPNPGTAPSQPRVAIAGSGNFSVTIGMETLFFTDVSGGIIVDSELMNAFTADGKLLYNDHMEGEPWQIMPGENVVSWEAEDGSRVDSVTILPRWRCI